MVLESPKVGVPKQAAEQVGGPRVFRNPGMRRVVMLTVVVARFDGDDGMGGRCGSILRAVPLTHEVTDAQHGRMEHQVAPAAFGGPLGAGGIGSQRLAEFGIKAIQRRVEVGGERDEVGGALLNPALWSLHLALT